MIMIINNLLNILNKKAMFQKGLRCQNSDFYGNCCDECENCKIRINNNSLHHDLIFINDILYCKNCKQHWIMSDFINNANTRCNMK